MEKEKKKSSKSSSYMVRTTRLLGIILLSLLLITILIQPNLGGNGYTVLDEGYTIRNDGYLPAVLVITPEDTRQRLSIEPWYTVLPQNNGTLVKTTESMDVGVTSVPYILPALWVILLAEINPYMPLLIMILLYGILVTIFLFPLWLGKQKPRGSKKKTNIPRTLSRKLRQLCRT